MKNVVLRTPALYCIISLEEPASLSTILWSCPDLGHESVACIVTGEFHKPSQEEVCDIIIIYIGGWGCSTGESFRFVRACVRSGCLVELDQKMCERGFSRNFLVMKMDCGVYVF